MKFRGRPLVLVAGLYVFVFPVAVFLGLLFSSDRETRSRQDAEKRQTLEQVVANASRSAQPLAFFSDFSRRLLRRLHWENDLALAPGIAASGAVRIFAFSDQGKRLSIPGTTPGFLYASEQTWNCLARLEKNHNLQMPRKDSSLLESFVGTTSGVDVLARVSGCLLPLTAQNETGILAGRFPFDHARWGRGSLLLIIDLSRISPQAFVRHALHTVSRKAGPDFAFRVIDLLDPRFRQAIRRHPNGCSAAAFRDSWKKSFSWHDRWIGSATVARRFLLLGATLQLRPTPFFKFRHREVLGFLAIWAGMSLVLMASHTLVFIPVRFQVTSLFAVAAIATLAALIGYADSYRQSWETTLVREYFHQNRDILDQLDNRYATALNKQLSRYRQLLRLDPQAPASLDRLLSRLRRFRKYRGNIIVGLMKPHGEIVYRLQSPRWFFLTGMGGRGGKTLSLIGKYAMNRAFREHLDQKARANALRDEPTDPAGGMANDLALHLTRARQQFFPILFEQHKYLLFPDFWLDRGENSHAFLLIAHQWRFLETQFLAREIKRLNRLLAGRGLHIRAVPEEQTPSWIKNDEALVRFHDALSQTRNPEYLVRPVGRNRWMVAGFPARHLEGFNLFLFAPMRPLEERLAMFVTSLEQAALLLFFFALLLAWFFASLLLTPLQAISTGIQRLAQGVFSQPVNVTSGDILERIGKGINEIMEELRQLLTAGEVQEQLFPHEPLVVKPASMAATKEREPLPPGSGDDAAPPAKAAPLLPPKGLNGLVCSGQIPQKTDLFMEYFDYLLLPDRSMAFWLVQAHGSRVSGALGLGNSKMALRLLFQSSPGSPGAVLEEYHRRFPEVVSGQQSGLRLLVGIVRPEESRLCFVNPAAFPLMNRRTGHWQPVTPTSPVDRLTADDSEQTLTLRPGDQIGFGTSPAAFQADSSTQARLDLACPPEVMS